MQNFVNCRTANFAIVLSALNKVLKVAVLEVLSYPLTLQLDNTFYWEFSLEASLIFVEQ